MEWNQSCKNYAADIASRYMNDRETTLSCLRFDSIAGLLNECYLTFVREKEITPIELLELEQKEALWAQAKKYAETKDKCIMISRSIYLLNLLTNDL